LKYNKWIVIILSLVLISLFNPYNFAKNSTWIFAYFFISHILFFKLVTSALSKEEIIKGIFDGLLILCTIQIILAICFPVLGIKAVTDIFKEGASEWSTRLGTREGAVGIFSHPGHLALFTVFASAFFLGCYLTGYNQKHSLRIILLNAITIILTYSRTSYLAFFLVLAGIYYIFKNSNKKILSPVNILKYGLPILLFLYWIVFFSPLSHQFLESDVDDMYEARLIHWMWALDIFNTSPFIGVGINAHLTYILENNSLFDDGIIPQFFFDNPIHNIHLIILSELGLIGFIPWLIFLISSISKGKQQVSSKQNEIFSLAHIGIILTYLFYGLTGWAPFSQSVLPFMLFFTYLAFRYRMPQTTK
jgi:O-antigen ligase